MTHLLVVDDDEDLATLYKEELTDDGYEVTLARSGKAALQSVDDKRPDLVVLDISMPDIDGIEALGKILGKDKTIPVILNTAYGIYKDNFMTWFADAYVVKSGDLAELKERIKEVLKELPELGAVQDQPDHPI